MYPPPLPLEKNRGTDHDGGNRFGIWQWIASDQKWYYRGVKKIGTDHKRAYPHELTLVRLGF